MRKRFQIESTATISAWIFLYHRYLIHLVDCTADAASGNQKIINTHLMMHKKIINTFQSIPKKNNSFPGLTHYQKESHRLSK
jgi:hypothetical protein